MASSEQYLAVAFDGIGPFPVTEHAEEGDIQRRSSYQFPHRDGQDVEAQGRAPLVWSGELVFFRGIEGYDNLWPKTFLEMKRRVRAPENGYLTHPLYGEVWGYFEKFAPAYRVAELNGCRVSFTFQEVTEEGGTSGLDAIDPMAYAKEQAAIADAGLEQLEVPTPADPPPPFAPPAPPATLTPDVERFEAYIRDSESVNADGIAAEVNAFRAKVEAILDYPSLFLAQNAQVRQAVISTAAAMTRAGEAAQANAVTIIEFPLELVMGPLEIAHQFLGDAERFAEVIALNPTELFEYPRGTLIRIPDL